MIRTAFVLLLAGLLLAPRRTLAQAPTDLRPAPAYRNWPLVLTLDFQQLTTPLGGWKNPLANVGISFGTEFGYNRAGTLLQSVRVGYYHNRHAGDGLHLGTQLGYRPSLRPLFAEVRAGAGALYTFHPAAALALQDGAWRSFQHRGTLTLMVPAGVSVGYSGRGQSPLWAPFVGYEVFLLHGYNAAVPLLPNRLLQVGVRSHLTNQ